MKKIISRRSIISLVSHVVLIKQRKHVLKMNEQETTKFKAVELSKEERGLIKARWNVVGGRYKMDSFKVFKSLCGFNPDFIPDELFFPLFSSTLNPYPYRCCFSNKGYYHTLFSGIRQPEFLLGRTNGLYYTNEGIIDEQSAKEHFSQLGLCFFKPTINSCQGNGCKFFDACSVDVDEFLSNCPQEFVIQRPVSQSLYTAALNADSLNCIRVTSLFINGEATAPTVCLKFGKKGCFVDNVGTGGFIIGVKPDGHLQEKAYAVDLSTIDEVNGVKLKDIVIPNVQEVVDFALNNHVKYFPNVGIIGWDIALNEDNLPVMIEANLGDEINFVGVHLEQIATSTPIFGDRTQEVIEFVCKHPCRHLF